MKRAQVRLRVDGRELTLLPGDLIGRLGGAVLRLTHPSISEVHALISLRGQHLMLIGLRGEIEVDGERVTDALLVTGQRIRLGGAVDVEVTQVDVPERVLALRLPDGQVRELCAGRYSLLPGPPMALIPRHRDEALAWVVSSAEGWRLRIRAGHEDEVRAGRSWELAGGTVGARWIRVDEAGAPNTARRRGGLQLVARVDTAHVHRRGWESVQLSGLPARLLYEVAAIGAPVRWDVVARELWRGEVGVDALRRRWDRVLRRLRLKLRAEGIRDNLVQPTGRGMVELFLQPGDRSQIQD